MMVSEIRKTEISSSLLLSVTQRYEAERLCQDLGISLEAALRLLAGNDRREFMNLPQDVTQPPCICGDKRS